MALFQAVIAGLIALILTPGWLFYFDVTAKVAVLLTGAAVTLLARNRAPRWFTVLLMLNLVSLAVSAAASSNPALSFFGTNWRRYGVVTQAAVWIFAWGIAGGSIVILRGVSVATAAAALYGIAQYFGWDPILPAAGYHIGEGIWTIVRPPATFGYVSYFATWLAMAAFLAMAQAEGESSRAWRGFAQTSAALALAALLFTGTRAALLAVAAGGVVWMYRQGWRTPRRAIGFAAMAVIAAAGFYFSPAGQPLRSRTRWFLEDPWGGARPTLWRDTLRMASASPMLGFGPEVYTATFPRFESKELARAYPDFTHESPHNIFLDALIAQGLPGVLLLGALCFAGFRSAWRAGTPWLAAALAAGLISQQFTVFTVPTAVIFYATIALAAGRQTGFDNRRRVPIALALPAALALLYCAARLTFADHSLALAKRSIEAGDARTAAVHYQRYEHWRLPGTSADLWYSRALMDLAQKTASPVVRLQTLIAAGMAGIQATKTAEDPLSAWYSLAAIYASRNDAAGTESSLRAAIAAHPNWFKPHWMLARLLQMQSRLDEAEREAALGAELNGGKDPEVERTLEDIRAQRAEPLPVSPPAASKK